ncbi:DNA repair helicase XPB [Alteribacter lacisalsi]|nr:DNA repair helicase XPB [Alteribacter lacisalsi]
MNGERPLLVREDGSIYLDTRHKACKIVQPIIQDIAGLVQSPSDVHVYKISPHSIWYACERGISFEEIHAFFNEYGKLPPPQSLMNRLKETFGKYGMLVLEKDQDKFVLSADEPGHLDKLFKGTKKIVSRNGGKEQIVIEAEERGELKRRLMDLGYPVIDKGGYTEGTRIPFRLTDGLRLRGYQEEAVQAVLKPASMDEGNGVIVMPCGSGKTMTGIALMAALQQETLILTPNETSVRQWVREMRRWTTLNDGQIGIYSGKEKRLAPVTVTTYQMLTRRNPSDKSFTHLPVFQTRKWGLILYDEVHLLPAPLFRFASDLQSTRRAGLTATCVREDGREKDIFSLVGPKRYELGIRSLEENGWLSKPDCREIKVAFKEVDKARYWTLGKREKYRFASENRMKLDVTASLLNRHRGEKIIIIGHYLDQLKAVSMQFGLPLITGETPVDEREKLFQAFRNSDITCLVLSKVANLALDLPDAQTGIQLSGTYGSRQEEAQRIGRLLRPSAKSRSVTFYSIVTAGTQEEERSGNRQLFMLDQGYTYSSEEWSS